MRHAQYALPILPYFVSAVLSTFTEQAILLLAVVIRMAHANLAANNLKGPTSLVKPFAAILSPKASPTNDLDTPQSFDLLAKQPCTHCEILEGEYENSEEIRGRELMGRLAYVMEQLMGLEEQTKQLDQTKTRQAELTKELERLDTQIEGIMGTETASVHSPSSHPHLTSVDLDQIDLPFRKATTHHCPLFQRNNSTRLTSPASHSSPPPDSDLVTASTMCPCRILAQPG